MNHKRIGALIAAAALALTACGGGTTASPTSATTPGSGETPGATATPAAPTAKDGGTIIVGLPGDIMVAADPTLVSDSNSSYIHLNVIEGLVGLTPGTTSDIIPVLATDLPQVSSDGLTYTFTLRQGIKFHDGTAFNSAAVKYNYERQKNAPEALRDSYNYYFGAVFGWADDSNLKSIDTPDDNTVVFHLGHPQTNFLLSQTLVQFGIQSPTALQAGDADNPDPSKSAYAQGTGGTGHALVGTGPFMFKEWVPNDHVTLVKNPDYWNTDHLAHLDSIVYKPYQDQVATLNALQAGDIDFSQLIAPSAVAAVQADSSLQVVDRGESCNEGLLQLNQDPNQSDSAKAAAVDVVDPAAHTLLANIKIRQAIAYALNKASYIDAFYAGQALPADNWMPPATKYYKALNLPTYNADMARQLIADSGVAASDLKVTLFYPSDVSRPYMPDPKGLAEAIATDLEAVGFTVTFGTDGWRTGYLKKEAVGAYPMWLLGWTCDWAGPDNFLDTAFFHFSGNNPNPEFAYGPPDLLTAFQKAEQASDDATQQAGWSDAQDILARDLPTVPLVNSTPPAAAKADVMGFQGAGNLTEPFYSVWLDR